MKAVFCCLNSKYIHSSLAPWCLFSACKQKCNKDIELCVVEGTINEPIDNITHRIEAKMPDIVLFSCYIWNINATHELCRKLKNENEKLKIVVGGPEVSYNAKHIFEQNECIDFVSCGEGEVTIPQLLNCIHHDNTPDICGISYRVGNKLVIDTREAESDNTISPYCCEYLDSLNGRIAYIESSRGCPFACAFCLSGRLGKVRYIDLDRVKHEMLLLASAGAKTVKFVDRTFNCHKERAQEILQFILENYGKTIPSDVCFHFEIAADLLDDGLFAIIEKLPVGSVQFEVGIQSFNEKTLQKINRRTDLKKVENNVKKLLSLGNCHVHIDLIAGLPKEDMDSFISGFNRAFSLKANMLQLGFLKILHGSPMAESKELYPCNHCQNPPYEVIDTPWITQTQLQKLHTAENELERLCNSGRFSRTLDYVLSVSGTSPFELFFGFGEYLKELNCKTSIALDDYTNFAYDYFCTLDNVQTMQLRDRMIYDRIATNSSGVIPEKLKIYDAQLKKVKNALRQTDPPQKGVNRSVAILYCENKVIYCDYKEQNKVSGEYAVCEIPFTKSEC